MQIYGHIHLQFWCLSRTWFSHVFTMSKPCNVLCQGSGGATPGASCAGHELLGISRSIIRQHSRYSLHIHYMFNISNKHHKMKQSYRFLVRLYIYDFVVSFVDVSSYFLSTFSYVFRALERVFLVTVFRPFPFFHLFPLLQVWVLFREACGVAGVWKEWKATWPHIFWTLGLTWLRPTLGHIGAPCFAVLICFGSCKFKEWEKAWAKWAKA